VSTDRQRLEDVANCIDLIERHRPPTREAFDGDHVMQTYVFHQLQILGEAAAQLSDVTRARDPRIPWRAIIATRNAIVHQYRDVSLDEIWTTITRDLPNLKAQVQRLLENMP
jgi:uncharacterized protein with HEPN domain